MVVRLKETEGPSFIDRSPSELLGFTTSLTHPISLLLQVYLGSEAAWGGQTPPQEWAQIVTAAAEVLRREGRGSDGGGADRLHL